MKRGKKRAERLAGGGLGLVHLHAALGCGGPLRLSRQRGLQDHDRGPLVQHRVVLVAVRVLHAAGTARVGSTCTASDEFQGPLHEPPEQRRRLHIALGRSEGTW